MENWRLAFQTDLIIEGWKRTLSLRKEVQYQTLLYSMLFNHDGICKKQLKRIFHLRECNISRFPVYVTLLFLTSAVSTFRTFLPRVLVDDTTYWTLDYVYEEQTASRKTGGEVLPVHV